MKASRLIMGVLYVVAGACHFLATKEYASILPDYLPARRSLVLLSGIAEIAAGLGLLRERTQRASAWGVVAILVAVTPANVWMVQHSDRWPGIPLMLLWLRLPLQGALICWAWLYTGPGPGERKDHSHSLEAD